MQKCIVLALEAKQRNDNPVGAVIVLNGQIIAQAAEESRQRQDITFHAEIAAIRAVVSLLKSQDLSQCILYTTHEPCIMCSYVIRHTKIHTVVIGLTTGETGGYSSRYALLSDTSIRQWAPPPKVITGILKKECAALHS